VALLVLACDLRLRRLSELKLSAIVRRRLVDLLRAGCCTLVAVSLPRSPVNTKPDRPRSKTPLSAGGVVLSLVEGTDENELRTGIEL